MIGTTGATVLLILNIILASAVGVAAGGLTCFALRRSWSVKAALIDALVALVVALITVLTISAIGNARGALESPVWLLLGIVTVSVVVMRMLIGVRHS